MRPRPLGQAAGLLMGNHTPVLPPTRAAYSALGVLDSSRMDPMEHPFTQAWDSFVQRTL